MSDIQPSPKPEPSAEEITPTPNRLLEFQARLANLTPRVWVTPLLLAVNGAMFVLLVLVTGSFDTPTVPTLVSWGGNLASKTARGEWWRLLTTTFLHLNVVHILLNLWVLAVVGFLVERMVGNVGFLLVYLISALVGSLATLLWSPMLVGVGAGGAIFGVCGALLVLVWRKHDGIPPEALDGLRATLAVFFGTSLLFGFLLPNADNASSVGGLLAGVLCGLVLNLPSVEGTQATRPRRNLIVALLGVLLVGGGTLAVGARNADLVNLQQEIERFAEVETRLLKQVDAALGRIQQGQLTDAEFAQMVERDVLPEWRATQARIEALRPPTPQPRLPLLVDYLRVREEQLTLLAAAKREQDRGKLAQSLKKRDAAIALIESLRQLSRK